jgi:hypothetical protein
MAKWRVTFQGETEVEADSALEAECTAAFDCSPDNCRADCIEGCDEEGSPIVDDEATSDEEEHF